MLAIAFVTIVFCAVVVLTQSLVTRPRRTEKTWTTMFFIHRRILIYAAQHGHPPQTLEDLPTLPGYSNELVDAWNRKIKYEIVGGNIVELSSLGKDGLPGGTGEDHDIVRRFTLRDKDGHWNDPLSDWLPPDENGP
jgi:hypothetical protein